MKIVLLVVFVLMAFVWVQLNMKRRAAWFDFCHITSSSNRERFEDLDHKSIVLGVWLVALLLLALAWSFHPWF